MNNTGKTYSQILANIKSSIYANTSLGESFMKSIGFSLSDMLISCTYNQNTCSSSNFTSFTTYDRGNCFMFNFNTTDIKTTTQTGQYYGLTLELFSSFDGNLITIET